MGKLPATHITTAIAIANRHPFVNLTPNLAIEILVNRSLENLTQLSKIFKIVASKFKSIHSSNPNPNPSPNPSSKHKPLKTDYINQITHLIQTYNETSPFE